MNNRYLQVLRTYTGRWRFWALALCYLLIVRSWWHTAGIGEAAVFVNLACITVCFIALHLRRQLATAAAHLAPRFVVPHLVVGMGLAAVLWLAVPAVQIWRGSWPVGALAMHALAGLLLCLMLCTPRAMLLILAVPIAFTWGALESAKHSDRIDWLIQGDWLLTAGTLGAVVLAHLVAIVVLRRLSDQTQSAGDDFTIEPASPDRLTGFWNELKLRLADLTIERRLERAGRGLDWPVARWSLPNGVWWPQVLAATLAGLLGMIALASWASNPGAELIVMIPLTVIFLCVPMGPWRMRRTLYASELLRPVSRQDYFRQLATAIGLEMAGWAVGASVLGIVGYALLAWNGEASVGLWYVGALHLAMIWSLSAALYGTGLITLRLRYWLPLTVLLFIGSFFTLLMASGLLMALRKPHGPPVLLVLIIPLGLGLVGLLLAWQAYRNWLRADMP